MPFFAAAALVLLLSPGRAEAAAASIHYFDHGYRMDFDMSAAVEEFAGSTGTVKLENVYNAVTRTNGARFVLEAPDKLSAQELERTTDYALDHRQDVFAADNSLLLPPPGLVEAFADSIKTSEASYPAAERLPADILSGLSPSGLKFKVLYIPSLKEKRLWEPTFKMVHRLSLDGAQAEFVSLAVPMGLNSPSSGVVEEASRKDTNLLLSLAPGSHLDGELPDADPAPMFKYLADAGVDVAALDLQDLKNFRGWAQAGVPLSSGPVEFVCSNVRISDPRLAAVIKPYSVRRIAGVRTAFIALAPYNAASVSELSGSPFALWNPKDEEALGALITELREKQKAVAIVAVSFYRREDFGWLMSVKGLDVIIGPKSWESSAAMKTRVELLKRQKEGQRGHGIAVFPDSSGSGKITLEFGRQGRLAAVETLPGMEDGTEPFYYREKTALKERVVERILGSGDSLLPDPRHLSLRGRQPEPIYAIPDFFNMTASLLRKRFKTEVAVLRLTPSGNNVLGDTPSSLVKIWLGPDEPLETAWVPGSLIRSFFRKRPPASASLSAYYSARSYLGREYYALSGLDESGRVAGLPLRDAELYLTVLPASLLQGKPEVQRVKVPAATLHGAVIDDLRALKTSAASREAWEKAVQKEALNITESRDIWRINLRSLALQMVNTGVTGGPGFASVNESRLSAVDQTRIQGSGRLVSEYYSGKFRFDSGVSADYGKVVLRPSGQPRVTAESVDQLVGEGEVRYRLRSYNGGLGPIVLGPFAAAAYDTEFSRAPALPLRRILRGKAGLKLFEGTNLQELYAGLTTEQIYTYSPARTQYAAETGFRLNWPIPGTALTLNADGNYRNFARSRFDTAYDLKDRLELNLKVSTRLYGDIKINPFVSYLLASGKKLDGYASNLTTGFSLEYSRLFKLKN
ncbi:MAG TPA: hypothetical protein DCZ92_07085 [Elusimicrobia bacterium]|nr:MAG: hypothetical protein A2016_04880 [Elusimicrobia bacterium GWF2_62_30]HBA60570.1 hypothetical protein [Elusimicrobiota bacterium]